MLVMSAAETVLLIMLAVFYSIYALENRNVEETRLFKHQNEDIDLFCGLNKKHEEFNRNVTVTWYILKVCKLCFTSNSLRNDDDWKIIHDARGLILTLDDSNSSSGYYMCKMFPYHVDTQNTLQIEITKTFQVEVVDNSQVPPPELFNDTMFQFNVEMNTGLVLQCKCRSTKPTTIKWFKQKAINVDEVDEPHSYNEIKYFENFYQPLPQVGLKMLDDNIYLSKLTISNITEEVSLYACVCVSYSHRFSFRNFTIRAKKPKSLQDMYIDSNNDEEETEVELTHDDRFFELIFIPLVFLLLVIFQVSAIAYLLIYRRMMKYTNKNVISA